MAFYQLIKTQKIPATTSEAWAFISNPANLKKITPEQMGFIITSKMIEERIYPGMIITYKVSPLPGIKMNWVTEITHVRDYEYFTNRSFGLHSAKTIACFNSELA